MDESVGQTKKTVARISQMYLLFITIVNSNWPDSFGNSSESTQSGKQSVADPLRIFLYQSDLGVEMAF